MIIYLIIAAVVFVFAMVAIWNSDGRLLSWGPEVAVISLLWPVVILTAIVKKVRG
jgi:hypothetical protein